MSKDHEKHYEKWCEFIQGITQSDLGGVRINGKALPRWRKGVFPKQVSVKKLPKLFRMYGFDINMDMARSHYENEIKGKL